MVQNKLGKDAFFHPPYSRFFEGILSDALEENDGKASKGDRTTCITNLRYTDDIDADTEEEQELEALIECRDKISTRYGNWC